MIASASARAVVAYAVIVLVSACAPRARPLPGAPAPATVHMPVAVLPDGYQKVVFRWRYAEGEAGARGEGVARIAPPDSARLDLFLDGGLGGTHARIIGDEIRAPEAHDIMEADGRVEVLIRVLLGDSQCVAYRGIDIALGASNPQPRPFDPGSKDDAVSGRSRIDLEES